MIRSAENWNILAAQLMVDEAWRLGLRHAVLCPGSRSTPLTIAVARHTGIHKTLCNDERAAAFLALGQARHSGLPSLVVCTSGTAVANLLPAAVEASQDYVPLLLFCGDRPPELRACGANQSIDQFALLQSVTRFQQDLPCPGPELSLPGLLTTVDEAWRRSLSPAGPVFLNCMFRKPLEPLMHALPENRLDALGAWLDEDTPWRPVAGCHTSCSDQSMQRLRSALSNAHRPLCLAGDLPLESDRRAVAEFSRRTRIPVLCDLGAGLRGVQPDVPLLHHADWLVDSPVAKELLNCDVLLRIGGRVLSKELQTFAADYRGTQFLLDSRLQRWDDRHSRLEQFEEPVASTLEQLCSDPVLEQKSADAGFAAWAQQFSSLDRSVDAILEEALAQEGGSEAAVTRALSASALPLLFCGNSMPIRHLQRFGQILKTHPRVLMNRGASGIDGVLATAVGATQLLPEDQISALLIGDLSLLHDANSLALAAQLKHRLRIIVLNNGGGAIFDQLPIREVPEFDPWFRAPQQVDFCALAESFGLRASCITGLDELDQGLINTDAGAELIEIQCPYPDVHRINLKLRTLVTRKLARLCKQ